jgi:MoxR-like ATPase
LPDRAAEREIVTGAGGVDVLGTVTPVTTPAELAAVIAATARLHCADPVVDYLLELVAATRTHPVLTHGVSPRVSSGLLRLARGRAAVAGRDYVTPDDVQGVFIGACAHRVLVGGQPDTPAAVPVLREILERVPVPRP